MFLKLSMKTIQVHLIIWTTLVGGIFNNKQLFSLSFSGIFVGGNMALMGGGKVVIGGSLSLSLHKNPEVWGQT